MIDINNLRVQYEPVSEKEEPVTAVDDVSFSIGNGEMFGLVGESGCGKSTIAKSILGVLGDNGAIKSGEILYDDLDLAALSKKRMRAIRGNDIAIIPQSSMHGFDPVYTFGEQMRETIKAHESMSESEMNAKINKAFEAVGLDPDRKENYPHQFSGGMKQRAMIAMAIVLNPNLIIADEPTTALDVISQDMILHYIEELQRETNASVLFISHDISVVAELCDRIGVMYAGKIAELGNTEDALNSPQHPYTIGLKNAFPSVEGDDNLIAIPGTPPENRTLTDQCKFAQRCPFRNDKCLQEEPQLDVTDGNQKAACFRIEELGAQYMRRKGQEPTTWESDEQ